MDAAVRLSDLDVIGDRVWWVEGRPSEGGRQVLVSLGSGESTPRDETPEGFSVRTSVHEYGGRCWAAHGSTLVFSNWEDQRLWVTGAPPQPLTPPPPHPRSVRYADPAFHPSGEWLAVVRETHTPGSEAVNEIAAVFLDGRPERVLCTGHDFFAAPRFSPAGDRLAWVRWNHPDMPWDATVLEVAPVDPETGLGTARVVAGGPTESVTQPRWSPGGTLHYISDRTGWWNIYDSDGRALAPREAEFAEPDWVFGEASYGFSPGGELIATWAVPGGARLGRGGPGGILEEVALPFSAYSCVRPVDRGVLAIAASPSSAAAVVRISWSSGEPAVEVLRRSREARLGDADISLPEPVSFPTAGAGTARALLYRPRLDGWQAPEGELPPLLVVLHGGPTSAAQPVLDMAVQFWTTRGFAVAALDYRGSSGYGRDYRRQLDHAWGIADVEDCAALVRWLSEQGLVDGARAVIRGGSAGGFTTLAALAFTNAFAAGASLYGVADLELLAEETHKFESRYMDRLVGPWPEAAEEYRRRSPLYHVDQIDSPVILFQGLEDAVVPPSQSEAIHQALAERGVRVEYRAFEGEQHGFRMASTIVAVAEEELRFYGSVLGFTPNV